MSSSCISMFFLFVMVCLLACMLKSASSTRMIINLNDAKKSLNSDKVAQVVSVTNAHTNTKLSGTKSQVSNLISTDNLSAVEKVNTDANYFNKAEKFRNYVKGEEPVF